MQARTFVFRGAQGKLLIRRDAAKAVSFLLVAHRLKGEETSVDVHRIVIGDQYYLQVSFGRYPICCVMNDQMILVNQQLSALTQEDALVLCVRQKKGEDLLSLPVGAISASARQRGVRLGMEAKEALLLLQKAQD